MKIFSTILLTIISISIAFSQNKQDYMWMLGADDPYNNNSKGYIINFNEKPAIPKLYDVGTFMNSNNASICDKNGELLFFTNGCHVIDRNGNLMENGDSLNYDEWVEIFGEPDCSHGYSGAQNIMILDDPGNENEYYIIHKPKIFNGYNNPSSIPLYFSKINLSFNEGKGFVAEKNIPFYENRICLSNYLTAINHINGKDWWIVQPLTNDSVFVVFIINEDGIEKIPNQNTGIYLNRERSSASGTAKFSPDGTKYALYNYYDGLHVYDFDRSSGTLSNHEYIEIYENPNIEEIRFSSVEWSTNSRFIYTASSLELHQIDLWEDDIQNDGIRLIDTYNGTVDPFATTFFLMAQGPDCRIYMCSTSSTNTYHVINQPDSLGIACDFVQNGIKLPVSSNFASFPNFPRFRVDEEEKCDPTIVSVFGESVWYRRDLKVWPNPSSGLFNVELPDAGKGTLVLMNMNGQLVYEKEVNNVIMEERIDIRDLPAGSYSVEYWPQRNMDLKAQPSNSDRVYYGSQVMKVE